VPAAADRDLQPFALSKVHSRSRRRGCGLPTSRLRTIILVEARISGSCALHAIRGKVRTAFALFRPQAIGDLILGSSQRLEPSLTLRPSTRRDSAAGSGALLLPEDVRSCSDSR
jgi:hypothetical protein